jgi:hypothetical protein
MSGEFQLYGETGREMDLLIHRQVMKAAENTANSVLDGYPIGLPHYSTDIADAWKLVEKLGISVVPHPDGSWHAADGKTIAFAATAPLAICRFALLAATVTE